MHAMRAARRRGIRGLYAITPDGLDPERLIELCSAVLAQGTRVLQLRAKNEDSARSTMLARALVQASHAHGALFLVNDDVELAIACGADGVHLGRSDTALAEARRKLPDGLIGASCYDDPALAAAAVAAGADYVAFGSVFASRTKPAALRAPLSVFAASAALGVPRVAIGGITRLNCTQVRDAGADACAVISDLFGDASDTPQTVAARAAEFRALLDHPIPAHQD